MDDAEIERLQRRERELEADVARLRAATAGPAETARLAALAHQEGLQRAQESAGLGAYWISIADNLVHATPALCRIHGLPAQEIYPAEAFASLVFAKDVPLVSNLSARRAGRIDREVEYRIRRPDTGEVRWINRRGAIESDAEGRPIRLVGVARDVTDEVEARQMLRSEHEQLAQLFERSPTFMAILSGPAHHFEAVNPSYTKLIGHRSVVGRMVAEALPEVVEQGFIGLLDEVYRSGKPFAAHGAKVLMQAEPGGPLEPRYLDVVYQPLRDAAGAVTGILVEGADVTARALADAELRETDRRGAALLALSDAIGETTDPGDLAFMAASIIGETFGVSRAGYGTVDWIDETITIERDWTAPGIASLAGVLNFRDYGSYIDDLKRGETVAVADVALDARTQSTAAALKAISAHAFVNMPLVEQGRFAALFYVNNAAPRSWSSGELQLMRDVAERVRTATERLRSEAALRDSERRFRTFTQAVPNHIWSARPDGAIDWVNEQALAYGGLSGDGSGGRGWIDHIHPDDLPGTLARWTRVLGSGAVYTAEFRLRRADGVYRWHLARALPMRAADGSIERWIGTNTDIEDQKSTAAALARLTATLEEQVETRTGELMAAEEALRQSQKMEAVGQLTGGIAHDFNNLLTGISGSLELLGTRIAQGRYGDIERYTTAAQGAARRAAALTHRLLAFSRRQTLDPRAIDVNRLVAGMEELVRRTVGPVVEIETVAAVGLWPSLVDAGQLENALLNLCINARDAMPSGGRITIETANRWMDQRAAAERDLPTGQYISLCVSDTGVGMPPDVIARAFEPFFTTKPLGVGTGLGLSMIYGFARQSGGQARIYSEVGQGTTVCLYLPRHLGEADLEERTPDLSAVPRATRGETVLVVDDEPTVRMLVMDVLESLEYGAIEAADGSSGLRVLQSDARIDLLVTDVGLPGGMNGRQMVDAARRDRPNLKVLFITGYAENAVVGNGHLEAGMHVMTKPFAMEALAARIKDLIVG